MRAQSSEKSGSAVSSIRYCSKALVTMFTAIRSVLSAPAFATAPLKIVSQGPCCHMHKHSGEKLR